MTANARVVRRLMGGDIPQEAIDGLAESLAGKAPTTGIAQSAVTNLVSNLASKATTTALTSGLAGKQDTIAAGTYAPLVAPPTGVDDTAVVAAAVAAGGARRFPAGTYVVQPVTISAAVTLLLDAATVIKLIDGATEGVGGVLAPLVVRSSDVTILGGTIDANRAGQNKSAFNTAGGFGAGKFWHGIYVAGTSMAPLTNVVIDTTIKNSPDAALSAHYTAAGCDFRVRATASGGAFSLTDATDCTVPVVKAWSLDNDGWRVYPHAVDFFRCDGLDVGAITVSDQYGTGTVAGGSALSDIVSGVTACDVTNSRIRSVRVSTRSATMRPSLGFSVLGCHALTVGMASISGYSELGLEVGGDIDCTFDEVVIDGRYQAATGANGRGIAVYNNAFYGDFLGRSQRYTDGCKFSTFTIIRCLGDGIYLSAARGCQFSNGKSLANETGLRVEYSNSESTHSFPGQAVTGIEDHTFTACDFSYNELHGVDGWDGKNIIFADCTASNNGQASSYPGGSRRRGVSEANPAGFNHRTTTSVGLLKPGIVYDAPRATDDQVWGDTASYNPSNLNQIVGADPQRYHVGQTIRLVAVGAAGATISARINDVDLDELTIDTPPVLTPTVAGTGTISSSGTTVTGVGSAFTTQIKNRAWITAAGQVREVVKVTSATSMTTATAFSPALAAGTTFVLHVFVTAGVQSQKYGMVFTADVLSPRVALPTFSGNITAPILDGTAAATRLVVTGGANAPNKPGGYVTGQWYTPPGAVSSTRAFSLGDLRLFPYQVRSRQAFDQMALEVTTAGGAGTLFRLGIWAWDLARGLPTGLPILDAGTVAGDSLTPAPVVKSIISTLDAGWYWIGARVQSHSGSPALRGFTGGYGTDIGSPNGTSAGLASSLVYTGMGDSGTLPDLTGLTPSTSSVAPVISLRAA